MGFFRLPGLRCFAPSKYHEYSHMKNFALLSLFFLLVQSGGAQDRAHSWRTPPKQTDPTTRPDDLRGSGPANDDCANAQIVSLTVDCATLVSGDNTDATQDGAMPVCEAAGTYIDVWYTLNSGGETILSVDLDPADVNGQDWNLGVYDACGGAEVYCIITPGVPQNVPVSASTDYWIRVWSNTDFGPGGPFTLCVTPGVVVTVPPNDVCADANIQDLAIGSSIVINGTNVGAIDNEDEGLPAVWEAFTTSQCADVHVSYCGTDSSYFGFLLMLYTDCSFQTGYTPGSYTACPDGNQERCYSNLPPGTYYHPIGQIGTGVGPYVLTFSAEACGTDAPVNDECTGAITVTATAACTPQFFNPSCASQSLPGVTCGTFTGSANDDVWYSFTATQAEMSIGVDPAGATIDPVIQVFSGSCGELIEFDCADGAGQGLPEDLQLSGLIVDDTYYFRVYDYRFQFDFLQPGYDLCLVEGLGSGVGLDELEVHARPFLYPNPTIGDITITVDPNVAAVEVSVIDATGRVVMAEQHPVSGNTVKVYTAGLLTSGLYLVRIDHGSISRTERLIVR